MPSFDTDVPALLLRLDANPFHHGTLTATRSLGRAGVEVHALLGEPAGPVCRSRYLREAHRWPAGRQVSDEALLSRLREIAARIRGPAVLVAMDDHSALATARLASSLRGDFLLPRQNPALVEQAADKAELARLCAENGIPHPRTHRPRTAGEAYRWAVELGPPVIAKWSKPWLLPAGSGLRSTSLVHQPAEAEALFARRLQAGSELLLQRRLPTREAGDWFFHGCFSQGGELLTGGTGVKRRSWPLHAGLTAVGTWTANEEIQRSAVRLATAVRYHGILDLDFRYEARTGAYHLLDFNPRPGAQFQLFTDAEGLDVVRALHLDLTGRPVPAMVPRAGRTLIVENYAVASALAGIAARCRGMGMAVGATADPRAASPRRGGGRDTAWFASDDPLPFLDLVGALGRRVLARAGRRLCALTSRRHRAAAGESPTRPSGGNAVPPRPRRPAGDSRVLPRGTTPTRGTETEHVDV